MRRVPPPAGPVEPSTSRHTVLGAADVDDDDLADMVAGSLGDGPVELLTATAQVFPYDQPAITTAGRYLVSGTARTTAGGERVFTFFVKVIHSYLRSPLRFHVPESLWATAATLVPWRTEADVYRSDLADRLPPGLAVPRAFAVRDLDDQSAALWLEHLPVRPVVWDVDRHARAAHLLGRLAASPAVRPLAGAVHGGRHARSYARSWLAHNVLPALHDDRTWTNPLVAGAFDTRLRRRLLAAADALPSILDELDDAGTATAHGDACTRNLLVTADRPGLTMVDFGFWGTAAVGLDLGQLILGEVQVGARPPAALPRLEAACLPAYTAGLRAEGSRVTEAAVRRTHALLMTVFSALPAVPVEHLTDTPDPNLRSMVRHRAALARFVLDLLDDTARPGRT